MAKSRRRRKPSPKNRAKAEKFFRDRVPLTEDESRLLDDRAKQQAFWMAQIEDLRAVDMILQSLRRAVEFGEDLDEWKEKIGAALRGAWGEGRRDKSGRIFDQGNRIETIYRNATNSAHNGSRFRRLRRPQTMAIRPFWIFEAERPTEFPHPTCTALNEVVRPANDPYWNDKIPPLHHNCQSRIRALTRTEANKEGLTDDLPTEQPDAGFGTPPNTATTALTQSDLSRVDRELRRIFDAKTSRGPT